MKYLALLRGINVGGKNIIKKDTLKSIFESVGCSSVRTYIQSGNVLFSSDDSEHKLRDALEKTLEEKIGAKIPILLLTEMRYKFMMENAPKKWNQDSTKKYNALFLIDKTKIEDALAGFPTFRQADEQLSGVEGVLFWFGSKDNYAQTAYARDLAKSSLYQNVTIRNGNTTLKLLELFDSID